MAETQVDFVGLNEQDQLALDSFRSINGQPVLPRHRRLAGRKQNTQFLQDFAHLKKKLGPRLVMDAVVAIYNNIPAGEHFTSEVMFTQQQLQHFGCHDTKRLNDIQLKAMMVIQGLDSSQCT